MQDPLIMQGYRKPACKCRQVVQSRTLGASAKNREVVRMLLPLVDLLNHRGDETQLLPGQAFAAQDNARYGCLCIAYRCPCSPCALLCRLFCVLQMLRLDWSDMLSAEAAAPHHDDEHEVIDNPLSIQHSLQTASVLTWLGAQMGSGGAGRPVAHASHGHAAHRQRPGGVSVV